MYLYFIPNRVPKTLTGANDYCIILLNLENVKERTIHTIINSGRMSRHPASNLTKVAVDHNPCWKAQTGATDFFLLFFCGDKQTGTTDKSLCLQQKALWIRSIIMISQSINQVDAKKPRRRIRKSCTSREKRSDNDHKMNYLTSGIFKEMPIHTVPKSSMVCTFIFGVDSKNSVCSYREESMEKKIGYFFQDQGKVMTNWA